MGRKKGGQPGHPSSFCWIETDWEKHQEVFSHLAFFWSSGSTSPHTISVCGRRSSFFSWKPAVSRALQRLVRAHVRCTLLLGASITRKSSGIVYKPQSKVFLWIFKTLKNSRSFFFLLLCIKRSSQPQKKLLVFVQKPVSVLAILYFNTFFFFLEKKKSCKDSIP